MNLRQLEAFRATHLMGSVTRAAEAIHVSQPSVGRLVSDREASVGFLLFEPTPRGLKSTPEAKRLFEAVEQSYLGIRQIKAVADAIRNLGAGKISFGMIPSNSGGNDMHFSNDVKISDRSPIRNRGRAQ